MIKQCTLEKETLKTFVDALIYEPCCEKNLPTKLYLCDLLESLPWYLEEFIDDTSKVFAGPELSICSGCDDNAHTYMID